MNLDALFSSDAGLRRLARRLVAEEGAAADVVQRAHLGALTHAVVVPRTGGGFVAKVRNLARDYMRSESRRRRRERAAARPESIPSTAELVAREELRRRVVEAVAELDEIYRAVVVLRYFEGLPPRAVAARLGVGVEATRTRLKRAHDLLRARLDASHGGDRAAWAAPAALWSATHVAAETTADAATLGGLVMTSAVKIALGIVGAGLLVWCGLLLRTSEPPATPNPSTHPPEPPPVASSPEADSESSPRVARAPFVDPVAGPTESRTSAASVALTVRLTSLEDDAPLPGVALRMRLRRGAEVFLFGGVTDSEGRVVVTLGGPSLLEEIEADAGPTSAAATHRVRRRVGDAPVDVLVTAPRSGSLAGRVVDATGSPIPGAVVAARSEPRAFDFEEYAAPTAQDRVTRAASDGTWSLSGLSAYVAVTASSPGRVLARGFGGRLEPGSKVGGVELVMVAPRALEGRVVTAAGEPVAGARVSVDSSGDGAAGAAPPVGSDLRPFEPPSPTVLTDADGRFVVPPAAATKVALGVRTDLAPFWYDVVATGDAPLEVRLAEGFDAELRLVDDSDDPVVGAEVALVGDGPDLPMTSDGAGRVVLRGLSRDRAGLVRARKRGYAMALVAIPADDSRLAMTVRMSRGRTLRGVVVDAAGAPVPGATLGIAGGGDVAFGDRRLTWANFVEPPEAAVDESGRFAMSDMPDAEFELRAFRPGASHVAATARARPGGADVVLRLPAATGGAIDLEIVDATTEAPIRSFDVTIVGRGTSFSHVAEDVLAADGRLRISPVPPGRCVVRIKAAGRATWRADVDVAAETPTRVPVRLAALRSLRLRVDGGGAPPSRAGRLLATFETADGAPIPDPRAALLAAGVLAAPLRDGRAAVDGLPAGVVRVVLTPPVGTVGGPWRFDVDLTEPRSEEIVLTLP